MNDSGAILDYASPRKRGALRLPAVSRIALTVADGQVTIVESLAGQAGAIGALAFGLFVLLVVGSSGIGAMYDSRHHRVHPDWGLAAVLGVAMGGELATMIGVVQQTWRRTVVAVEYDEVRLAFLSPLHRRRYRWTNQDIADIVIAQTASTVAGEPLGEVLITRVVGGEIRLFTDHPAERLVGIARAIHDMLREGHAVDPPPDPATRRIERLVRLSTAEHPLNPGPQAEQTTGRLVDLHRGLRERRGGKSDPSTPG